VDAAAVNGEGTSYDVEGLARRFFVVPVRRVTARPVVTRSLDKLTEWDDAVRSRWPFSALVGPEISPDTVDGDGSRLLLRPALIGFLGVLAITLGVSQQDSPFVLKMPGAWFFGVPASSNTPTSTHGLFLGLVAVYGGLVLLMRAWYSLIRTTAQLEGIPVRKLVWIFALWVTPLIFAPPLFSRDVYSYVAQGEMMSHHISPYHYGPGVLGDPPSVTLVDKLWLNTPAPYGPLFMSVDGFLTSISFHHELPNLILLRMLSLLGVALMAIAIPSLARSMRRDAAYVFTIAILNPVTVLHLVGGAHNDGLMLGLLLCGLALAKRGRPLAGIVLCSLAAAVKVPAAIGIIYIAWEWTGTNLPWRERVRPLVTAGIVAVAVMGSLSLVTGLGWSWILNLATPGTVRSWVAPATGIGILATDLSHAVGVAVPLHVMLSITRLLGLGTAAVVGVWLLLHSERVGTFKAMGITMLLVVALGPVVQPWYLSWGLILLAPVAVGRIRTLIVGISIGSAFIGLPGARQLLWDLLHANPLSVAVALLACLAILTVPLTPFDRNRLTPPGRRPGGSGRAPNLDYAKV
jgi:alpha-1,6-mannosyltransferase